MGANASTAVPLYASGQVLDAARLNLTNAGIPVFSGTATRDAAFDGSGEKVLAEGQFAYLEDTNALQYYDGAAFQPVGASGGLTLVSTTTIGTTVSSVTVSSAFSATYDTYLITISGGVASTNTIDLKLTLGATATGYNNQILYGSYNASPTTQGAANGSSFPFCGTGNTSTLYMNCTLLNPFLSKPTIQNSYFIGSNLAGGSFGYLDNSTSYTAFTITTSGNTMTGGTIRVYGYANS